MAMFHKTSDTYKTGSMTLSQKYYTSDEVPKLKDIMSFSRQIPGRCE